MVIDNMQVHIIFLVNWKEHFDKMNQLQCSCNPPSHNRVLSLGRLHYWCVSGLLLCCLEVVRPYTKIIPGYLIRTVSKNK